MSNFHMTLMGKKFFEGDVPRMVKGISEIKEELSIANDLKERELLLMDRANQLKERELQLEAQKIQLRFTKKV